MMLHTRAIDGILFTYTAILLILTLSKERKSKRRQENEREKRERREWKRSGMVEAAAHTSNRWHTVRIHCDPPDLEAEKMKEKAKKEENEVKARSDQNG